MNNKSDIRTFFLQRRREMPEAYRQEAAIKASQALTRHSAFAASEHIACYFAHPKEFETIPLIQAIWQAGKKCYLPILCEEKVLSFVQYDEGDKLEANHLGILEPYDFSRKIALEKLDMVIMPLVAFDSHGRRLGMGGGFYDRTFAFAHAKPPHTHFVGLAYATQQAEELPADPWDINLNSVLTEQGIKTF